MQNEPVEGFEPEHVNGSQVTVHAAVASRSARFAMRALTIFRPSRGQSRLVQYRPNLQ
jgi:hypothetical protein